MSTATSSVVGTELKSTVVVAAPGERVWALVSDLARLSEWSPQVVRSVVTPSPARPGSRLFNLNHQGWKVWPTSGRVVRFLAGREIAFRINENRTVWSFRLEPVDGGTLVTHRRETPDGISPVSNVLVGLVLGGQDRFVPELLEGMAQTLDRIKAAAEG